MLLLPTGDGKQVDVEHATDGQFQQFIAASGVSVDEQGIVEWCFDDRCGVIYWAIDHGLDLAFEEIKNTLEIASESASQAVDV